MNKSNLMTIIAIDRHSSDTMSRTFNTDNVENFKKGIEEFENELPFSKYELMCNELISDYSPEIIDILDELEIETL